MHTFLFFAQILLIERGTMMIDAEPQLHALLSTVQHSLFSLHTAPRCLGKHRVDGCDTKVRDYNKKTACHITVTATVDVHKSSQ